MDVAIFVDFDLVLDHCGRLLFALVVAVPVGLEREHKSWRDAPGLRTYPLVSVSCCGFVLIGLSAFSGHPDAQSRVLYGLMTGMGFIGGGAILKHKEGVVGTASAASLWATGAMGAAIGFRRDEIAIALALLTLVNLLLGPPAKRKLENSAD